MKRLLPALFLALTLPLPALAEYPRNWYVEGVQDVLEGQALSTAVQADGAISLSASLERLARVGDGTFMDAALSPKGDKVILGTANEAGVYLLDVGKGESNFKQIFSRNQGLISAVTFDNNGRAYAAMSPNGQIFRGDDKGNLQPFYTSDERYIWDMLPRPDGLYFVTGDRGALYRLDGQGKAELLYKSPESNLKTLYHDPVHGLLLGGGSRGLVYRYEGKERVTALLDTEATEVNAIVGDGKGNLFVAATRAQPTKNQSRSLVYWIDASGRAELIFQLGGETAHSLALNPQGTLFVGTGSQGRVYHVQSPTATNKRMISLPARSQAAQVTAMIPVPGEGMLLLGGSPAVVEMYGGKYQKTGIYQSQIFETELPSQWGELRFNAQIPSNTAIKVMARSGSSQQPDHTWSDWTGPYTQPAGQLLKTPPGRFLQLKFELTSNNPDLTPLLHSFDVSFQRENQPPRIRDVYLLQRGVVFTPQSGTKVEGPRILEVNPQLLQKFRRPRGSDEYYRQLQEERRQPLPRMLQEYRPGMLTLAWDAEDANDDELLYDVHYRLYGESQWRVLAKDIPSLLYSFNTAALMDGQYHFRVYARDHASNLTGGYQVFRDSELVTIDNGAPEVKGLSAKPTDAHLEVSFQVQDAVSPLAMVEVAMDGQNFQPVSPEDGITDGVRESFRVRLPKPAKGNHFAVVKATDRSGNTGTATVRFSL
jgi:outer membrane protein assembly factor BamB